MTTSTAGKRDNTVAALRVNPDWAKLPLFDRSKWQRVRFGDVVENLNETERNPEEAGIERFIGLEHLEPGSLHIRTWGNIADGTTFTRRCRPRQLLFGKRRAYQGKVAVAEFDAVVSGDIYVFAPKNERLLPELLPFLCISERFFKFAVETSAGSLSPRTNWSHLVDFEFDLPPLDQQRCIAEILLAVNRDLQLYLKQSSRALDLLRALCEKLCWSEQWREREIKSIASSELGSFVDGDWIESKDQSSEGIRLLQLADIGDGRFLNKSDRYISEQTFSQLKCTEVMPGDMLISRMADPIGRACIVPNLGTRMITAVDCAIVRIDTDTQDPDYWLYMTGTSRWRQAVASKAGGSTRMRISRKNLEGLRVPMPALDYQIQSARRMRVIQQCVDSSRVHANHLHQILSVLLSTVFQ